MRRERRQLALRLLGQALSPVVRTGRLTLVDSGGGAIHLGDGRGLTAVVRFADWRAPWALLLDPDLKTGELFTDQRLIVDEGSVFDFLSLVLRHGRETVAPPFARAIEALRTRFGLFVRRNSLRRARRNVVHHYDLGDDLYALFLDPDWQYSCAYFEDPGQSLAEAQEAKKRHIAAKLAIGPGSRVLDIGCGWGGLALYLAQVAGAGEVTGITLSDEQLHRAGVRAERAGLSDRVRFRIQDYRDVQERFDRIVSVGMFEHVGLPDYGTFFRACRERLTEDGVMLLHTIGSADAPSLTNPWITKHIFPGGHLPSLSQIAPAIERAGLLVTDVEVLRLHYALTLRAWRVNFLRRRSEAAAMFDERFCRMWEYYLAMSEAAFRHEDVVVFQIQLARRIDTLPLTRDYMAEPE